MCVCACSRAFKLSSGSALSRGCVCEGLCPCWSAPCTCMRARVCICAYVRLCVHRYRYVCLRICVRLFCANQIHVMQSQNACTWTFSRYTGTNERIGFKVHQPSRLSHFFSSFCIQNRNKTNKLWIWKYNIFACYVCSNIPAYNRNALDHRLSKMLAPVSGTISTKASHQFSNTRCISLSFYVLFKCNMQLNLTIE